MTLSDLWDTINQLKAAGRPTDCVEIIANTIEFKLKRHGHKKIKDFDISGILSDIADADQAFESEYEQPRFLTEEGEVAWILCANAALSKGAHDINEEGVRRPRVVGPVAGHWS